MAPAKCGNCRFRRHHKRLGWFCAHGPLGFAIVGGVRKLVLTTVMWSDDPCNLHQYQWDNQTEFRSVSGKKYSPDKQLPLQFPL